MKFKMSPDAVRGYGMLGVAVAVNAGAPMVYSARVMDAYAAKVG